MRFKSSGGAGSKSCVAHIALERWWKREGKEDVAMTQRQQTAVLIRLPPI
jgi:hypothetical protein